MSSCAESGWPIRENNYDPNGNRLLDFADGVKTATTVGDNNQLTAVGDEDFMTDFFGNTTDINDGVTDQFFEYNWERNLTQAYLDESYSDTHEYDGNGRRMRSKLNSAANWTHFVHDELTEQVLCEFTLVSSTFTLKAANTYGWGLISSNRETVKRYFHFDGLGNTVALTDSSGDVQDTYVWTAFGLPLSSTGSSVNPYRFVGQWGYYDDGAMGSPHDFVLCDVRYYAPRFGRFLTWDPIGTRGYGYCGNVVTLLTDPSGLKPTLADCERWRQACTTKAQGFLSSCLTGVGAGTAACLKACPSTGPYALACVIGCFLAAAIGAKVCQSSFEGRINDCEKEYQNCLFDARRGPPGPPSPESVCYAGCMLNCLGNGKSVARCQAFCTKKCGSIGSGGRVVT